MSVLTTSAEIGKWLWENKADVRALLDGIRNWFRGATKDKRGILVLGPGGAGKTTLARILAGDYDFLFETPRKYDESLRVERYTLTDAPNVEIVVPPGQEIRRPSTWPDLHRDLATGKYRGIILVAANGYDSLSRISYKDHPLCQGDRDAFLKAFLENRRTAELTILQQLTPHLQSSTGKMWLLTLVAKQDLWWPERSEVEKRYREGGFATAITALMSQRGQQQFRHEMLFASLVISNFADGVGERLQPNTEGYDHQFQVESLRRVFETVNALKEWEESK